LPHRNIPGIQTSQFLKRSINLNSTRITLITTTFSANKHTQKVDLMQIITDTTRQCRKIVTQVPKLICFVLSAMNKVWQSNISTNSFTKTPKASGRNTRNDGGLKRRNSTPHRKLLNHIRRPKNNLIILTSQVHFPKSRRHLHPITTV